MPPLEHSKLAFAARGDSPLAHLGAHQQLLSQQAHILNQVLYDALPQQLYGLHGSTRTGAEGCTGAARWLQVDRRRRRRLRSQGGIASVACLALYSSSRPRNRNGLA